MKKINLDMELNVDGIEETLRVIGSSLYIGNEYDNSKGSVFLEDVSKLQNKQLVERLEQLNKIVSEACREIKVLAIEAYENECNVEGCVDIAS